MIVSLSSWPGRLARLALDTLLPPRCLKCGGPVDHQGGLCPACWSRLTFLAPPLCACCGLPFEFEVGEGALCGGCVASPPLFRRARAALVYDEESKPLVLGFKRGDQTYAAEPYGAWLARAGADLLGEADLLVPVPLHRWRLFRRRYNQAALLALATAKISGVALEPRLLVRRRATPSQNRLDRAGRRRNVKGAFAVRAGADGMVRERRIVLVDDVFTTGATVSECVRALLKAGAARVDVLTLARVVRPGG
ncbi:MAG TPA: ComF family protein [Azospirillaceae bacterium]|nr:ComF family protein [Azospirillaceae bacterium]